MWIFVVAIRLCFAIIIIVNLIKSYLGEIKTILMY